jgi:hypothetical protein
MDDTVFLALRKDPPPEFAKRLHATLQAQESIAPARRQWPIAKIAASMAIAVGMIGLFNIPAVRASAQSFLAMFRVVNFVAVPVDEHRIDTLKQLDLPQLAGEHMQVLQDAGPPIPMPSPEQAAAAAGIPVRLPGWLPEGGRIVEISVRGENIGRVTADAIRLQQLMEALGISDLKVPAGLDGQMITIRIPPVLMIRYEHSGRHTRFFQARSPEVTMPAGIDASALGEIGLRILGLPREDARQFARAIDWNTTLLVAVPPTASSFKQVDIAGKPGIAIEHRPPNESHTSIVLWSADGRVYGMVSIQEMSQVMRMANSVR